ncbi:hypothetical protein [Burkholderia plantarii]|uniref:Uncharacterized protein n=1 Tax=Burkholderia plantarii TaxID=41899 RepID=A0A0B6RJ78_BURPL|nr:hypothetical protein [Burkholderia plantarii]AJK45337.1 hypothetical protein BGL_1c08030 [Burkholderia plantarii]
MKLDLARVHQRIAAIVQGRDDRLLLLLQSEPARLRQPSFQQWLRQLARDYEDDVELLACVCPRQRRGHGAAAEPDAAGPLDQLARTLALNGVAAAFSAADLAQDAELAAQAAWAIRWNFEAGMLSDLQAGNLKPPSRMVAPRRAGTGAGPGLLPGIIVPPGVARHAALGRAYGQTVASAQALVVDLTYRPGLAQHGHALARYFGDAVRDDITHVVGALLDATPGSTLPHRPDEAGADGAYEWSTHNIDMVEATLDVLANAVRERRVVLATRPRASLWQRL